MRTANARIVASALALLATAAMAAEPPAATSTYEQRVATVMNTPGCVAFWDFVKREPAGAHRFTAHVLPGTTNDFALDAGNYIKDYWGEGPEASYADFPLLGRGPFGQAARIRKEEHGILTPRTARANCQEFNGKRLPRRSVSVRLRCRYTGSSTRVTDATGV